MYRLVDENVTRGSFLKALAPRGSGSIVQCLWWFYRTYLLQIMQIDHISVSSHPILQLQASFWTYHFIITFWLRPPVTSSKGLRPLFSPSIHLIICNIQYNNHTFFLGLPQNCTIFIIVPHSLLYGVFLSSSSVLRSELLRTPLICFFCQLLPWESIPNQKL